MIAMETCKLQSHPLKGTINGNESAACDSVKPKLSMTTLQRSNKTVTVSKPNSETVKVQHTTPVQPVQSAMADAVKSSDAMKKQDGGASALTNNSGNDGKPPDLSAGYTKNLLKDAARKDTSDHQGLSISSSNERQTISGGHAARTMMTSSQSFVTSSNASLMSIGSMTSSSTSLSSVTSSDTPRSSPSPTVPTVMTQLEQQHPRHNRPANPSQVLTRSATTAGADSSKTPFVRKELDASILPGNIQEKIRQLTGNKNVHLWSQSRSVSYEGALASSPSDQPKIFLSKRTRNLVIKMPNGEIYEGEWSNALHKFRYILSH